MTPEGYFIIQIILAFGFAIALAYGKGVMDAEAKQKKIEEDQAKEFRSNHVWMGSSGWAFQKMEHHLGSCMRILRQRERKVTR